MTAVCVRDLVESAALRDARVVGGLSGLAREVSRVVVWELGREKEFSCSPGDAVVVLDAVGHRRTGAATETLMRRASGAGAVLVVAVVGADEAALSTERLADRLGLATVVVADSAPTVALVSGLIRAVTETDAVDADALLALSEELGGPSVGASDVVAALRRAVGGHVAVVTAAGVLAGDDVLYTPAELHSCLTRMRFIEQAGGELRTSVVQPVLVMRSARADQARPAAWIVVQRAEASRRWTGLAERAASIARGALTAALARAQLIEERSARERARTLAEILHAPESAGPELAASARRLGLVLSGWHIGIHVVVVGDEDDPTTGARMEASLREYGVGIGPVVEHLDGWAAWSSVRELPSPASVRHLADTVAAAARPLTRGGLQVRVGVGAAQRDIGGIARTLVQARQASLSAASSAHEPVAVRVTQDLGASRMLLGWYGSDAFRDVADEIIAPLAELGDEQLLRTLEAYLDRACSASHTARALGVHRNTVNQRVGRIEQTLSASLTDPDTRLALQLALRARRRSQG